MPHANEPVENANRHWVKSDCSCGLMKRHLLCSTSRVPVSEVTRLEMQNRLSDSNQLITHQWVNGIEVHLSRLQASVATPM